MKSFTARVILFYSALLSIFVIVSGVLTIRRIENALFLIAFLPVALYLVVTAIKEIGRMLRKEGPSSFVSLSGRKTEFIAGIVIFIALIAFGVKNLTNHSAAQDNDTKGIDKAVESEESTPIIFEKKEKDVRTLLVTITDGSSSVNLRSGPGTFHEVVGEAKDGEEYVFTEESQDWYKIDFEGKEAWIFENYAIVEGTEND